MVVGGYIIRAGQLPMIKVINADQYWLLHYILIEVLTEIYFIGILFLRFTRWWIYQHFRIERQCGILKFLRLIDSSIDH